MARYAFPIQRSVRMNASQYIEPFWPESIPQRSQDLEPAYHEAGQFYWGRTSALLERVSIYAGRTRPHVLPSYRVQDIDTEEDWLRAEHMHRVLEEMSCEL